MYTRRKTKRGNKRYANKMEEGKRKGRAYTRVARLACAAKSLMDA